MGLIEFDIFNGFDDFCFGFSEKLVRKRKLKNSFDFDENSIRISFDFDKNFLDLRSKWNWYFVNYLLNFKFEFFEEIIDEYFVLNYFESRLIEKVRNYFIFLGWKIDYSN